MTSEITKGMLSGQVRYGDTFDGGRLATQRAIERILVQGARYYSARKSEEYLEGYNAALKIVRDGYSPARSIDGW